MIKIFVHRCTLFERAIRAWLMVVRIFRKPTGHPFPALFIVVVLLSDLLGAQTSVNARVAFQLRVIWCKRGSQIW